MKLSDDDTLKAAIARNSWVRQEPPTFRTFAVLIAPPDICHPFIVHDRG
jgi:hypothetical protein